ncbi:hypothetical protein J6590_006958 [Homalodisca vitripennis]|nr:hypothetical protein J6590_006958 [Homalodisca vitripennis]
MVVYIHGLGVEDKLITKVTSGLHPSCCAISEPVVRGVGRQTHYKGTKRPLRIPSELVVSINGLGVGRQTHYKGNKRPLRIMSELVVCINGLGVGRQTHYKGNKRPLRIMSELVVSINGLGVGRQTHYKGNKRPLPILVCNCIIWRGDKLITKVTSGLHPCWCISPADFLCYVNCKKTALFKDFRSSPLYKLYGKNIPSSSLYTCCVVRTFPPPFYKSSMASRPWPSKNGLASKIIYKLNFIESCKDAFRELGLLTFPCLYILDVADVHQLYETRGRDNFRIVQHRMSAFEHLPSQVGVKLINKLPEGIKHLRDSERFKSRLKHLLVSKAF